MPSENKTKYLKLNQWTENDRPMRNDFNSDNSIVDSALGGHITDSSIHITAEEKEYLRAFIAEDGYAGNGESSQTISFTQPITAVIVYAVGKGLSQFDSASGKAKTYMAVGHRAMGASSGVTVSASATSITVSQKEDADGNILSLNEQGVQYKIIIFR